MVKNIMIVSILTVIIYEFCYKRRQTKTECSDLVVEINILQQTAISDFQRDIDKKSQESLKAYRHMISNMLDFMVASKTLKIIADKTTKVHILKKQLKILDKRTKLKSTPIQNERSHMKPYSPRSFYVSKHMSLNLP